MKTDRLKSIAAVLFVMMILLVFSAASFAEGQSVFGPKDFRIGRWHVHLSVHSFSVEAGGEGLLVITKNTPDKRMEGGFLLLNGQLIGLHDFLEEKNQSTEREVFLRSRNILTVFLRGTPGATISITVRKGTIAPAPQVTFQAVPEAIILGESSTLEWATAYADRITIDQGIGDVAVSGSLSVSPKDTTTYTLTATGVGGTTTASTTVGVTVPPPTVSLSVDPETIVQGASSTLTWRSTNAESCAIEPGIGRVDLTGLLEVTPVTTTTYRITATGLGGTATDSVEVRVIPAFEYESYGLEADEQEGGGGLIAESIRIVNGNVVEVRLDLDFPSPNRLGLRLLGVYNSRYEELGSMGHGWTHTYEVSLEPAFAIEDIPCLRIIDGTAKAFYFREEAPGEYSGLYGEHSRVKTEAGGYIWYRLDGSRYRFLHN